MIMEEKRLTFPVASFNILHLKHWLSFPTSAFIGKYRQMHPNDLQLFEIGRSLAVFIKVIIAFSKNVSWKG